MRRDGRAALTLAVVTAVVCVATGAVYIGGTGTARPGDPDPGWWLATLGLLGGSALGVAGLWQYVSEAVPRLIALVALATLSAGYVAANVLALVASSGPGWPQAARPLHVVGTVLGGILYVVTLVEASRAFAHRRSGEA
ncbi:MAG TPA: hypothetical protein VFR44_11180 [Actinomycetota bacterium]|nr:hypothetical protein [Actinomycetota bacterium]